MHINKTLIALAMQLALQAICKHLRVYETKSCDAICRDCGKNLGFIQNWRDTTGKEKGSHEISN